MATAGLNLLDTLLALGLVSLAGLCLGARDPFKAVVLFMGFGLLMALAWVRLNAPDLAVAEAAIGAGITGALLLAFLGRQSTSRPATRTSPEQGSWQSRLWATAAVGITALLISAVLALPARYPDLALQVAANLVQSGNVQPVTGVLLNFRGYDTLLEVAVLLLALVATWSLALPPAPAPPYPAGPILQTLTRAYAPLWILAAGYLVLIGTSGPGGAFQGGAILGAAGILLLLAEIRLPVQLRAWHLRGWMALGLAVFWIIAVGVMIPGNALLQYPSAWAKPLILAIELAACLSIGGILAALYAGHPPAPASGPSSTEESI